jgi:hypothetical protein
MTAQGHVVPEATLRAFGLWKEPRLLKAYTNGVETVIAKSPEDATECLKEHIGYADEDMEAMNSWEEIEDSKYLEIRQDELNWYLDKQDVVVLPKNYQVSIRARISEWIASCGRTVLCSTEW